MRQIKHHRIQVSELHKLHVIEAGNRRGFPLLFLHGGPGSGVNLSHLDYIDDDFYHVFMIDQRGSGESAPLGELKENNLQTLIEDIETVRQSFDVTKWLVTGGSWGSLLAVSYSLAHRNRVAALVLRGVFLGRAAEIDWLYAPGGAALYYPQEWRRLTSPVLQFTHDNVAKEAIFSYYRCQFNSAKYGEQFQAAEDWIAWASISMENAKLLPNAQPQYRAKVIAKAKIMCHYLSNGCFIRSDRDLLSELSQLSDIPLWIVHGGQDVICRPTTALELANVHENTKLVMLDHVGHSPTDRRVKTALRDYLEEAKQIVWS